MSTQTYTQRRAERAYCSVQQLAQQPWTGEPAGYHPEVEQEPEFQPARWSDAAPFLCVVAFAAGLLLGLRIGGVL